MLDRLSKKFLDFLDEQPDSEFSYLDDAEYPEEFGDTDKLLSLVQHLNSEGYVENITTHSGQIIGVRLSHLGLHRKEALGQKIKEYILEKWIDFLALIIAIIALIRTI